MLLFVQPQVLLCVRSHLFLLVIQHAPLHGHELTHSIRLEDVEKMLQPHLEVLGVLIHVLEGMVRLLLPLLFPTQHLLVISLHKSLSPRLHLFGLLCGFE